MFVVEYSKKHYERGGDPLHINTLKKSLESNISIAVKNYNPEWIILFMGTEYDCRVFAQLFAKKIGGLHEVV